LVCWCAFKFLSRQIATRENRQGWFDSHPGRKEQKEMKAEKNIQMAERRKETALTAPSGYPYFFLSGVERRCLLTSTVFPLSVVRSYGFTGTIFFPSFVFDIKENFYRPTTCRPRYIYADAGVKNSVNVEKINLKIKKVPKKFADSNIMRMFVSPNSLSCGNPQNKDKNRNKAGLPVPISFYKDRLFGDKREGSPLPYIHTANFRVQMPNSTKNCKDAQGAPKATLHGAKTVPIKVTLTGVRNPYIYAIRKAFFEFLQEESNGYLCPEARFVRKFEAAALLFPEHRKAIRGRTVIID